MMKRMMKVKKTRSKFLLSNKYRRMTIRKDRKNSKSSNQYKRKIMLKLILSKRAMQILVVRMKTQKKKFRNRNKLRIRN
jgi:hypothetical protein